MLFLVKQGQQNDDRDWKAYQPEKDIAHIRLRLAGLHSAVFSLANDARPGPVTELPAALPSPLSRAISYMTEIAPAPGGPRGYNVGNRAQEISFLMSTLKN
jgi:hypothetical protein